MGQPGLTVMLPSRCIVLNVDLHNPTQILFGQGQIAGPGQADSRQGPCVLLDPNKTYSPPVRVVGVVGVVALGMEQPHLPVNPLKPEEWQSGAQATRIEAAILRTEEFFERHGVKLPPARLGPGREGH